MAFRNKKNSDIFDLVIIGAGPAGLSAAINASIRDLDCLLFGADRESPKLLQAPEVNNYLGFPNISGKKLSAEFLQHLQEMGVSFQNARIDNIYDQGDKFSLISGDNTITARSLILTVGVSNEKTIPGEKELVGKGVSYCATCDGPLYRGKEIAAMVYSQEGLEDLSFLVDVTEKVHVITDDNITTAHIKKQIKTQTVEVLSQNPVQITGENKVQGIQFEDGSQLDIDGVFIFRRVTPPDSLLQGLKTEEGHIEVDRSMETSKQGVFAAGDCTGLPYQIAKAVGEGQVAALSAASFIQTKGK